MVWLPLLLPSQPNAGDATDCVKAQKETWSAYIHQGQLSIRRLPSVIHQQTLERQDIEVH